MYLTRLELRQFRNMEQLELLPCPGINVIYGDNAQGKTNLAEAIWLFTGAKSFRGAKERELLRFGAPQAQLKADFVADGRQQEAILTIDSQRSASLNQLPLSSASQLAGRFLAVVFSPSHLALVQEGPALRRRFLDTALSQLLPQYGANLREYQRLLDQRGALLRDAERFPQLWDTLDVWDQQLAKRGAWLLYCRAQYVARLRKAACPVYGGISSQEEQLTMALESSIGAGECMNREELSQLFLRRLQEGRAQDIQRHSTGCGPHRDDLALAVNGQPLRLYGSQGQQRSAVLALKLAECAILEELSGESPIVLLDDVMSELDSRRRSYLLNKIQGRQVFVTCCARESPQLVEQGRAFRIQGGRLREEG